MPKLLIIVQGPVFRPPEGPGTLEVLEALERSVHRASLHILVVRWRVDEAVALSANEVLTLDPPERAGSCHRHYQATAVTAALQQAGGFSYVLKTRSDVMLSDDYLGYLLRLAEGGCTRLAVTDYFTRWEPFHLSDMLVFGRREALQAFFHAGPVYYEDLFSPEVQFARSYVRGRKLGYACTLEDYLRFLREEVELTSFERQGLRWLKAPGFSARHYNHQTRPVCADHDCGPALSSLVSERAAAWLRGRGNLTLGLLALALRVLDAWLLLAVRHLGLRHSPYTTDNRLAERDKPLTGD